MRPLAFAGVNAAEILSARALSETATWIPCPNENGLDTGWELATFAFIITEAICTSGLALQVVSNVGTVCYLSELQTTFGIACPRHFIKASSTFDGSVDIFNGGNIRFRSATYPGTTDPFFGQTVQTGDVVLSTGTSEYGWIRSVAGSWVAMDTDEPAILVRNLISATGSKLIAAVLGEDLPESGSITGTWPARVGSALAPAGAGSPTVGKIQGRRAAVFSSGATAQGFTFTGALPEYWAVAQWTGATPFTNYFGLIGGQTTSGAGVRLITNGLGSSSSMYEVASNVQRDGTEAILIVPGTPYIWRATGTAGIDPRQLGCSDSAAVNNWQGPVGCALGFSTALTASEADQVLYLLTSYYRKQNTASIKSVLGVSSTAVQSYNLCGKVTISNTATSVVVNSSNGWSVLADEFDTNYYLTVTPTTISGTPAAGSNRITSISKATNGFTINVEAAPGTGNSITFDWHLFR